MRKIDRPTSGAPRPRLPADPILSRRDALRLALAGAAMLALPEANRTDAAGLATDRDVAVGLAASPTPFVPENDYPYFGFEPDAA
jgi:hypothetical protein